MGKIEDFRRRSGPGWSRPDGGKAPGKRLKGLDEFEPPEFVSRMTRLERRGGWNDGG